MRPIVRPPLVVARTAWALLLSTALALAGGCGSGSGGPEGAPGGSRFGASYEILTSETEAAPEEPPVLRGDTLALTVAYPGGGETHGFSLGHETQRDTARLWLRHDAAGDEDSTRVLDAVRLPIPSEARNASTIMLLNPQGGDPFVLRWAGE